MGLDINLNTSKIDISEEDGLNVDLYKDNIDISDDEADDIIIEITGLKSINKFIGLEDTPLYYDNGKFFKVKNNKIVYTDIEWKDITGDISESPEIIAVISDLINEVTSDIVDERINLHNLNEEAHPYIQNTIQENYNTLDTKIDDTKEELSQDISNLNDALNQEISDRETADNALSEDIQEETLARIETDTTLQNNIDTLTNNLNTEIENRTNADNLLRDDINNISSGLAQEIIDRQTQDNLLQEQITSNYNSLDNKIDTEIENRTNADVTLQNNIDAEVLARQNADTVLQNNINMLSQTVTDNNTAINNRVDGVVSAFDDEIETINTNLSSLSDTVSNNYTDLDGKISDLTTTVNNNDATINNKVDGINTTLTNSINNLSDTVSSNYTILDTKINNTKTSLEGDISDLSTTVLNNYTTLDGKITNLTSTVNDNYTELDGRITTNTNNISTINSKIPNQASNSNQLADKDFVNSSIATNTANFIGTFNSVAELEAYTGTLTNNDYAFVATTDTAGNTLYDRYKYNADTQEWMFEYELNNSSFTATQWASINSGIDSNGVAQITLNQSAIGTINTTLATFGNIVTHNVSEFATATQGTKADTALQPNDNISDLYNDVGYTTNEGTVTSVNNVTPDANGNVTLTIPDPTNMVTTNTAQNITAKKTFIGEKAIYFKQTANTDKLGFTLYNSSDTELGALEWRPNTISGNALLALNCPQSGNNYVGFRYWSNINIIAPRPTTNGNYFIPVNVTDGTNTVTANNKGILNISTLLPDVSNFVTNSSLATTLADYQPLLVSGTNIKSINNISLLGSGNIDIDSLPTQTGNNGKFLTTNGTTASWADTTKVTFRDWSVA